MVQRELRAEARNRANYWARVYAGLLFVLMFAGVMLLADRKSDAQSIGATLFGNLQSILISLIWLGAPLLTADCIARERRDGTLGLLFLTPLSPVGIALGKSLIHVIRSFTLLLVAVPVMALPVLLGGVTWKDGLLAILLDLSSLLLALSAGLFASTLTENRVRAVLFAEALSVAFLVGFVGTCGTEFVLQALPYVPLGLRLEMPTPQWLVAAIFASGIMGVSDVAGIWREVWMRFPVALQDGLLVAAARNFLLFGTVAASAVGLAALRLRCLRRAEPNRPRTAQAHKWFLTPKFGVRFFRRRRRAILGRNPILWLQGYTTGARMNKWGWCMVMLVLVPFPAWWPAVDMQPLLREDWLEWYLGVFVFLAAGMAFCSANSFRDERENGALELLLVTPLTVRQIVAGRLQGIWIRFLPAVMLLVVGILFTVGPRQPTGDGVPFLCVVGSTFVTLPLIGMLLSTVAGSWIACWMATFLVGMASPLAPEACMWCVGTALDVWKSNQFSVNNETVRALNEFWNMSQSRQFVRSMLLPFVSQWLVALGAALALQWRLKRRLYGQR